MGTNYYLHNKPACKSCGRAFEALHIGKSSAGWCFTLHVIPGEITTLNDWKKLWNKSGVFILDEYGEKVPPTVMINIITKREGLYGSDRMKDEIFLNNNHAILGPEGLLRHKISSFCVGHGEGTWDYCEGDFS